jgi:hypothetical protein
VVSFIRELAPWQRERMPSYAREWIDVVNCTQPVHRARFERATAPFFHLVPYFLWVDSPLLGELTARIGRYFLYDSHGGRPFRVTPDDVRSSFDLALRHACELVAGAPIHPTVRPALEAEHCSKSVHFDWASGSLRAAVRQAVSRSVHDAVYQGVGHPVDAACSQLLLALRLQSALLDRRIFLKDVGFCGGNLWAAFPSVERFLADVGGLVLTGLSDIAARHADIARTGHYWWPFDHFVIASERPVHVAFDAEGRLHDETGMAVRYRDGWGIHAWHGVVVPGDAIERPESISIERIEGTLNAEERRVLIERVGFERYLAEGGGEEVMRDRYGTLFRKKVADEEDLVVVRVLNPTPEADGTLSKAEALAAFSPDTYVISTTAPMVEIPLRDYAGEARFKAYYLRVPPDVRTAHEAVAWTFGMSAGEYAPDAQS